MTEERKKYTSDEDLERMLSPRSEFHVSENFTARVIKAAVEQSTKRWRRRRLVARISTAAVIAFGIIVVSYILNNREVDSVVNVNIAESQENDTTKEQPAQHPMIELAACKASIEINHSKPEVRIVKRNVELEIDEVEYAELHDIHTEISEEYEGPLPLAEEDVSESYEIMERFEENRRIAKLAYVDFIRAEIKETEDFIARMSKGEEETFNNYYENQ